MSAADFFDTNVLLYLLSSEQAKADRAEALLADGGVVSVQVLNEFASVASRKLGLRMDEIRDLLAGVRFACKVAPLGVETHDRGLDLAERTGFSMYDSLIVAAALEAGCSILHTEDMQHGRTVDGLLIRNPFRPA